MGGFGLNWRHVIVGIGAFCLLVAAVIWGIGQYKPAPVVATATATTVPATEVAVLPTAMPLATLAPTISAVAPTFTPVPPAATTVPPTPLPVPKIVPTLVPAATPIQNGVQGQPNPAPVVAAVGFSPDKDMAIQQNLRPLNLQSPEVPAERFDSYSIVDACSLSTIDVCDGGSIAGKGGVAIISGENFGLSGLGSSNGRTVVVLINRQDTAVIIRNLHLTNGTIELGQMQGPLTKADFEDLAALLRDRAVGAEVTKAVEAAKVTKKVIPIYWVVAEIFGFEESGNVIWKIISY